MPRPLRIVLKMRRDGVQQGYHMLDIQAGSHDEQLNHSDFQHDPATIVQVVGQRLQALLPSQPFTPHLVPTESDLRQLLARWSYSNLNLQALMNVSGIHDPGTRETAILPRAMAALAASRPEDRFPGVLTVIHEYWHHARADGRRFVPFEEGSAELFTAAAAQELYGITLSSSIYPEFMEGVQVMAGQVAPDGNAWLFASRAAPDQVQWLRDELNMAGITPSAIQQLLSYVQGYAADWLKTVHAYLGGE